ncbi:MAG: NAD-dependent epimerase/dehydratase family protein [Kofleriaceae bacterium]
MKVLVIGGNRFVGRSLVLRLRFRQHEVTVLNRGTLASPKGVEVLRADRGTDDFDRVLAGRHFDAVVDFAVFTGDDARRAMRVLDTEHYLLISTGQVYLVREGFAGLARETDYDGTVMAGPPSPAEHADWAYGIGKREAEDVIAAAPVRTTRLRIPMVSGEGDPKRRFDQYLWRMLDGGPLFVPNAMAVTRHVYRGSVVDAIVRLVEQPPAASEVYNVAQEEQPPLRELIEMIGFAAGMRVNIIDTPVERLAGLDVRACSPFSSRWMSRLDPARAIAALDLHQVPLEQYVHATVQHILATWGEPPPGFEQRRFELAR